MCEVNFTVAINILTDGHHCPKVAIRVYLSKVSQSMEKILVATDLSVNSISAIRFAYNLSQTRGATLVIVHVYSISKPKSWRMQRFENHKKTRRDFIWNKLSFFLDQVFSSRGLTNVKYEIDLQMNANTVGTILKCAARHKCSHLCISTHGLGKNKNVIGHTARKIIAKSPIPVFSIPSLYKENKTERICLVSNMMNYVKEIKKVTSHGHLQHDEIRLLHIASDIEDKIKTNHLDTRIFKRTGVALKSKYAIRNPSNTLLQDIDKAVKKIRPSLVIFFIKRTQQSKSTLFDADTPALSLYKKIPLLLFKK